MTLIPEPTIQERYVKVVQELEKRGFKVEIEKYIRIPSRHWLDIYAERNGEIIVIEIGKLNSDVLWELKKWNPKIRCFHYPYISQYFS